MGRYSLRNGKITLPTLSAKHLSIENTDNEGKFVAPYLKVKSVAKGLASEDFYLYIGTARQLMMSTTAPIGTSGAFANKGGRIGTAA